MINYKVCVGPSTLFAWGKDVGKALEDAGEAVGEAFVVMGNAVADTATMAINVSPCPPTLRLLILNSFC